MGINKGFKVDGWQKKDMAQRYLIRAGGTPIKWTSGEPGFWNARKYAHGPRDEGYKQSMKSDVIMWWSAAVEVCVSASRNV